MMEGITISILAIYAVAISQIFEIKRLRKDIARLQTLATMRHFHVGQSIQYIPDDSHQRRFHDDHRP